MNKNNIFHRTLINIVDIKNDKCLTYIPSWSPDKLVSFSIDLLPIDIKLKVIDATTDIWLIAKVNTGATKELDLQFKDFEEAPPLNYNNSLA